MLSFSLFMNHILIPVLEKEKEGQALEGNVV